MFVDLVGFGDFEIVLKVRAATGRLAAGTPTVHTLYPAVKIKTPNLPIITKLREFLSDYYRQRVFIGILSGKFFFRQVFIDLLS
jgi:hypothetical protein